MYEVNEKMDKKKKKYNLPPIIFGQQSAVQDDIYPTIDNDLAQDNLLNDITEADLQDLK